MIHKAAVLFTPQPCLDADAYNKNTVHRYENMYQVPLRRGNSNIRVYITCPKKMEET